MEQDWIDIWNEKHCQYIVKGSKYRNRKMVEFLVETLTEAKKEYYNTGNEIMNDKTYDLFEGWLKLLDPKNSFLDKVGA